MRRKKSMSGIKLQHYKNTANCQTETMPVSPVVFISMAQHLGAPCTPIVEVGDTVHVGQPIGTSEAFLSATIHSSVSGKVESIKGMRSLMGGEDKTVVIKTDRKQTIWEGVKVPQVNNREDFIQAIKDSGLVGLGGAAFPTHIKFNPQNLEEVDTLVINGAECEPYITSDHRIMLEETEDILEGMKHTMKYLDLKKAYIGIEGNKPDAIEKITNLIKEKSYENMEVVTLKATYPQGAERVLIHETTGKTMDAGVLPAQLGVILCNITTIAFISKYLKTGMPLISKRITVDGSAVKTPKNITAIIGTQISEVIKFCGGYKCPPNKIIMGGPMMGKAVYSDNMPIVKNNNAILAFSIKDAEQPKETACISCGRCFTACPLDLMPFALHRAYEARATAKLEKLYVFQCMECGSCAHVCPARLPLGFINKLGKEIVKEAKNK